jgi:indole-3-glycerol phosphate synthase
MTTKWSDKLAEIIAWKRKEIEPLLPREKEMRRQALLREDFRGFRDVLFQPGYPTLIAEVKKASPSAGVIAADFDPVRQALAYEAAGANALSVLTDEKFFQGKLEYLQQIREQVDLPLLRKDFTVAPVQIYEAVLAGADAILLIVAALSDDELIRLYETAKACQLDVLVEVHNLEEMDRALDIDADIIGINNRNLKSFEVSLETSADLAPEIPAETLAISESGIRTREDIVFLQSQGIFCYLIGETLMRSGDLDGTVRELLVREEA